MAIPFVLLALLGFMADGATGQGARERPRYVLQALDLDHDGVLSAEEIAKAPASLLRLDRSGDGVLTPDELEAPRADAGATPDEMVAQLMRLDANGDGVLTPDEVPERMQPMFARGDANHDGRLTPEEIRQMAGHTGGPNGRPGAVGTARGMMRLDPVLNALDADHDGMLSASEIRGASAALLTLDVDGDGRIEATEMRVRQQTPAERVAHVLEEFDTNKDGKLSLDEVPEGLRARFVAADKDGDGFLDGGELLQMFAAMQTPAPQQSSPGPGATAEPKGR